MELHNLKPAVGSNKSNKRVGRGPGSGYKHKVGFEGGQMPLQRRVPKFGFNNINRVEYKAVNLDALESLAAAAGLARITVEDLRNAGLVSKKALVKVLGNGAVTRAIEVEAHAFSKAAEEAIKAAGGSVVKK